MNRKLFFAVMIAGLLVACGGEETANVSAPANDLSESLGNASIPTPPAGAQPEDNRIRPVPEPAGGVNAPDPSPPLQPRPDTPPPPAPSAGKRPAVPPPQPKAEPDPHAGHDMSNMASMQH